MLERPHQDIQDKVKDFQDKKNQIEEIIVKEFKLFVDECKKTLGEDEVEIMREIVDCHESIFRTDSEIKELKLRGHALERQADFITDRIKVYGKAKHELQRTTNEETTAAYMKMNTFDSRPQKSKKRSILRKKIDVLRTSVEKSIEKNKQDIIKRDMFKQQTEELTVRLKEEQDRYATAKTDVLNTHGRHLEVTGSNEALSARTQEKEMFLTRVTEKTAELKNMLEKSRNSVESFVLGDMKMSLNTSDLNENLKWIKNWQDKIDQQAKEDKSWVEKCEQERLQLAEYEAQ